MTSNNEPAAISRIIESIPAATAKDSSLIPDYTNAELEKIAASLDPNNNFSSLDISDRLTTIIKAQGFCIHDAPVIAPLGSTTLIRNMFSVIDMENREIRIATQTGPNEQFNFEENFELATALAVSILYKDWLLSPESNYTGCNEQINYPPLIKSNAEKLADMICLPPQTLRYIQHRHDIDRMGVGLTLSSMYDIGYPIERIIPCLENYQKMHPNTWVRRAKLAATRFLMFITRP